MKRRYNRPTFSGGLMFLFVMVIAAIVVARCATEPTRTCVEWQVAK